MMMATQVVSIEDDEAIPFSSLTIPATPVSVYFQILNVFNFPRPIR